MKKAEFYENPAPVEIEGKVLRICFDVEQKEVEIEVEGQEAEKRTLYLAYVIRVNNPFTVEHVKEVLMAEGVGEDKAEAIAAEALLMAAQVGLIHGDAVSLARQMVLAKISVYDESENVNQFSFQGTDMWLNKDTRNGLIARLNAEKAIGKETSTLWLGTQSFTVTPDDGLAMLSALEVYASECYDKTAEHKAAVMALADVDSIVAYDYTTGYPEKLSF